ncbi:ShTK domain-containing protein [Ditylenchus destructor]|uniref:ShTK domain-containing protein n=1 Tax=Ditylenchus destructor TaxID=166010 RepID=A0AAD4MY83_9BILA|nr:ShTK domain-containing protein [Ditylenchus destructor]
MPFALTAVMPNATDPKFTALVDVEATHGVDIFNVLPPHCFNTVPFDNQGNLDKFRLHEVELKKLNCKDTITASIGGVPVCHKLFQTNRPAAGTAPAAPLMPQPTYSIPTPPGGTAPTWAWKQEQYIDDLCVNPNFAAEASWCAKSCHLCCLRPEYNCDDKGVSSSGKCLKFQNNQALCDTDPDVVDCLQTCGKCDQEVCEDRHVACHYLKGLCFEPQHQANVQRLCPLACDREARRLGKPAEATSCDRYKELVKFRKSPVPRETDCEDTSSNCQANIMLCEDEVFMDKMKKGCRATCGHCVKEDFVCKDKDSQKCDKWFVNGFCDVDSDYTKGAKLQYCPEKCKICPTP